MSAVEKSKTKPKIPNNLSFPADLDIQLLMSRTSIWTQAAQINKQLKLAGQAKYAKCLSCFLISGLIKQMGTFPMVPIKKIKK